MRYRHAQNQSPIGYKLGPSGATWRMRPRAPKTKSPVIIIPETVAIVPGPVVSMGRRNTFLKFTRRGLKT
jgi:hypothetical protein